MRTWAIAVIVVVGGFYGARIADDPLAGLAVAAIVGAFLWLGRSILRKRRQSSPPKRS